MDDKTKAIVAASAGIVMVGLAAYLASRFGTKHALAADANQQQTPAPAAPAPAPTPAA